MFPKIYKGKHDARREAQLPYNRITGGLKQQRCWLEAVGWTTLEIFGSIGSPLKFSTVQDHLGYVGCIC